MRTKPHVLLTASEGSGILFDKSSGRSGKRLMSVWDKAIESHLGPWGSILDNNLGQFQYSGDRVEAGQTERVGEIRSQLKWGRRQLPRPHPLPSSGLLPLCTAPPC